jgi:hypothetical protein
VYNPSFDVTPAELISELHQSAALNGLGSLKLINRLRRHGKGRRGAQRWRKEHRRRICLLGLITIHPRSLDMSLRRTASTGLASAYQAYNKSFIDIRKPVLSF